MYLVVVRNRSIEISFAREKDLVGRDPVRWVKSSGSSPSEGDTLEGITTREEGCIVGST